jgi:hypothetical protein
LCSTRDTTATGASQVISSLAAFLAPSGGQAR